MYMAYQVVDLIANAIESYGVISVVGQENIPQTLKQKHKAG